MFHLYNEKSYTWKDGLYIETGPRFAPNLLKAEQPNM